MFLNFPRDFKAVEPAPGWLVYMVAGERLSISRMTIKPNSEAPAHTHPNEQMGIILEGEFELTIGKESRLLKKGDMYHIPSNVRHGGVTRAKEAQILDVFSPPREYQK